MTSVGCVYHFFESDSEHEKNLQYFLKHGILDDLHYVIMLASEPNFELPHFDNVEFHRIPNEYRDIGGYIKGYKEIQKIADWDYIFFLNSGVLGPLPLERFASKKESWATYFLNLFDENIQLVGTSINTLPRPSTYSNLDEIMENSLFAKFFSPHLACHVQSFFFCLKKEARHFLAELGFFEQDLGQEQMRLIVNFEIALSQIILNANGLWTIKSNLERFSGLDFKNLTQDPNPNSAGGDPYYPGTYFGTSIEPRDAVFFKTTRWLLSTQELESIRNL